MMALSKKDLEGEGTKDEPVATKSSKGKASVPDTPSGQALAEVGPAEEGESKDELIARAEKYEAAKRKQRWG
jgi:hypothetical protein